MLEFAKQHASFLEAEVAAEVLVPGVYEELVIQHAARKLIDLAVQYGKPVALGISGPGMSRVQALERVNEYARRAVEAAVKTTKRLEKV